MNIGIRDGGGIFRKVCLMGLFSAFFAINFHPALFSADGDPVELTIGASPSDAGETDPSGTVAGTAGTPLQLSAIPSLGWKFSKWVSSPSDSVFFEDESNEDTFAVPSADAEISALFETGQTFVLVTSVYPEGAGTVTASATGQLNAAETVELTAIEASQDSIFYKWTCSAGAEVLDPGNSKTGLIFIEGAEVEKVTVTAHFLTRDADAGSAKFKSFYRGNISGLSILRKNKAVLNATLPADMSEISVSQNCTFSMVVNAGTLADECSFSEDVKARIKDTSGSVSLQNMIPGAKKVCGRIKIRWSPEGFNMAYTIKPPNEHNFVSLYSDIYKQGDGRFFAIDSSQSSGIPAAISLEDNGWCFVWAVNGGLDYRGRAKSYPSAKIGDDIVSWNISGKGSFARYSWRTPDSGKKNALSPGARSKCLQSVVANAARKSSGCHRVLKGDIDTGKVTSYPIWQQAGFRTYGPVQIQAPFFFNGNVYTLSRPTTTDANYKKYAFVSTGAIDDNGFMKMNKSYPLPVGDARVALYGDSTRTTTCVFKGKVYLFYDIPIDEKYYKIYSCSSEHPEATWGNDGFLPMIGTYMKHGGFKHTPLKAVPFNGKIYLIYGAPDGRFHIQSSPDGETWTHVYTLDDAASWGTKYLGEMNACVVTKSGQPMLCIAILGTEQNDRWMYLRFINAADKLAGGWHYYLDWVSPHHGIGIAAGTISGTSNGQAVQVFAQSSSWEWYTHIRTATIDVESFKFEGWRNLPIKVSRPGVTYCDALEAVSPVSKTDQTNLGMRKQIVLFSDVEWGQVAAAVFKSDLYSPDGPPLTVDTSKGKFRDKSSWSLLGVIHGVPPFTRNGNEAKSSVSRVTYTRKNSNDSKHDYEFESVGWVNFGAVLEATAEGQGIKGAAGINIKDTLSLSWGWREHVEAYSKSTFYSDGLNKDGSLGQLVFLAPTLKSQPYCVFGQDGKVKLLSYNLINVKNLNIEFEKFKLDNPPQGLATRAPTSNLEYWRKSAAPTSYDPYSFDIFSNNISVSRSNDAEGVLSRSWSGYFKVGNKADVSLFINGQAVFGLGLKGELGAGVSFDFNYTQEESWGETMTYNLSQLPDPTANSDTKIDNMVVSATWYHPKPQTNLQNIPRPEWVPDEFKKQTQVPWLLSWEILSMEGTLKTK